MEEESLACRRTVIVVALLMWGCWDLNELLILLLHNLCVSVARGVQCKSCHMERWVSAHKCLKVLSIPAKDAEEKPCHRQKELSATALKHFSPDFVLVNCLENKTVILPGCNSLENGSKPTMSHSMNLLGKSMGVCLEWGRLNDIRTWPSFQCMLRKHLRKEEISQGRSLRTLSSEILECLSGKESQYLESWWRCAYVHYWCTWWLNRVWEYNLLCWKPLGELNLHLWCFRNLLFIP